MIITTSVVLSDYKKIQKKAKNCFKFNKINSCLNWIKNAANLMYNANIFYKDDTFEDLIGKISDKLFVYNKNRKSSGVVLFYDYFVMDGRGLTEQYIEALYSLHGNNFVYIASDDGEGSKNILSKLNNKNVKVIFINKKLSELERTKKIFKLFYDYNPSKIIVHTAPWDTPVLVVLRAFKDATTRYLINITDHAFWLGVHSFDYFFEFRDYGYNISREYRGIPESKLIKMPYYPIINKNIKFNGFKFDTKNKIVLFSGGSIYKTKGSTSYFDIIKYILNKHDNVIFYFLGNGDFSVFERFVKENSFEKCFIYEKERKDIYEVFKHIDIYLNTYPLIGGLMTQYACITGKLPITLNDNNNLCNNIYELMNNTCQVEVQFNSIERLLQTLDLYICDNNKLITDSKKIKDLIISENDFNLNFKKSFSNNKNYFEVKKYMIDTEAFSDDYIKRFNENNNKSYYQAVLQKSLTSVITFPLYFIKYGIIFFRDYIYAKKENYK